MNRLGLIFSAILIAGGLPVAASAAGNRAEPAGYGVRHAHDWAALPPGSVISVRTIRPINATYAAEGRTYPATIAQSIVDPHGRVVIPQGSPATLVIRRVREGGNFKSSSIVLALDSVRVNGRRYMAVTDPVRISNKKGIGKNERTAKLVGGGAILGTLVGALAGGGHGAAIGAAAGAAAGGGYQVATKGHRVRVPSEAVLNFRLEEPLHLREM